MRHLHVHDPRPEGITTKQEKEAKVEALAKEWKERNTDKMELQYQLWARMIITGVHADKDVLPQIPIISGVTPKWKSRDDKSDLQETIINTLTAVPKVVNGGLVSSSAAVGQSPSSQGTPASSVIVGRSGNLPLGAKWLRLAQETYKYKLSMITV